MRAAAERNACNHASSFRQGNPVSLKGLERLTTCGEARVRSVGTSRVQASFYRQKKACSLIINSPTISEIARDCAIELFEENAAQSAKAQAALPPP